MIRCVMNDTYHTPVLLQESMEALNIKANGIYVDVTFGGGGHSREILKHLGPEGKLVAFDQDPDAASQVIDDPRFVFVPQNYRFMKNHLKLMRLIPVDGILADLGVSSHQFNKGERGFSIRFEGDLDMRMAKQGDLTAAKIINTYPLEQLTRILKEYGEVEKAYKVAKLIVDQREEKPVKTTMDLIRLLEPLAPRLHQNKFFARIFQALRIEVNQELEALEQLLVHSAEVLKPQGRLCVISYHSLEDRMVKNFTKRGKFSGEVEKDFYGNQIKPFKANAGKAIVPSAEELERNTRSRSARLRIAEKI